jgi:hypothetical protein
MITSIVNRVLQMLVMLTAIAWMLQLLVATSSSSIIEILNNVPLMGAYVTAYLYVVADTLGDYVGETLFYTIVYIYHCWTYCTIICTMFHVAISLFTGSASMLVGDGSVTTHCQMLLVALGMLAYHSASWTALAWMALTIVWMTLMRHCRRASYEGNARTMRCAECITAVATGVLLSMVIPRPVTTASRMFYTPVVKPTSINSTAAMAYCTNSIDRIDNYIELDGDNFCNEIELHGNDANKTVLPMYIGIQYNGPNGTEVVTAEGCINIVSDYFEHNGNLQCFMSSSLSPWYERAASVVHAHVRVLFFGSATLLLSNPDIGLFDCVNQDMINRFINKFDTPIPTNPYK